MLCEVLNLNIVEVAKSAMQSDVGKVDALDLHTLHQLAREVQTSGRSRNGTLVLGKYTLEVVEVVLCSMMILAAVNHIAWQRSLAKRVKLALELVVRTVVEEAQCASAACCVVDNLSHHRAALVEEELIAYTYLACRLNEHIPKAHLLVKLTQEEHLNLGVGLLLCTIEASREHLCVVEDESVVLVEIVEHIAEVEVFALNGLAVGVLLKHVDSLRFLMQNHQSALITTCDAERFLLALVVLKLTVDAVRIECNLVFG